MSGLALKVVASPSESHIIDVKCVVAALKGQPSRSRSETVQLVDTILTQHQDVLSQRDWSAIFSALGRAGAPGHAVSLLRRLQDSGSHPSLMMYNSVLGACQKSLAWESALEVLAHVAGSGLKSSGTTLNPVVSVLGRCKRWRRALALFECLLSRCSLSPPALGVPALPLPARCGDY